MDKQRMTVFDDLSIQTPKYETFGDNVLWAYSCFQMMWATYSMGEAKFGKKSFMIRAKAFKAYKEGTWHIHNLYVNNIAKVKSGDFCWYCGKTLPRQELTVEHVFPRAKGGADSANNSIFVCKNCNSSKGKTDLVEWFVKRHQMPHYFLIGHYLKQVYLYAADNDLMEKSYVEVESMCVPFNPRSVIFLQNARYLEWYLGLMIKSQEQLSDIAPDKKD